jgi:hypothetical protein
MTKDISARRRKKQEKGVALADYFACDICDNSDHRRTVI